MFVIIMFGFSGLAVDSANAQTGIYATVVNASYLNVRTAPSTSAGVIAVIKAGYSYPVLGRTADSGWWLLSMSPTDSITGWASGWFLSIPNQQAVPVIAAPNPTPATFSMGTVTAYSLNVRAIPDPYNGAIMTKITGGQVYMVIGRNNIGTRWWQIRQPNGSTGWVNGKYLTVTNETLVPITDYNTNPDPNPVSAYGTVTAYFLNVRTTPNPYIYNIIAVIARHQTFPVVGRNAAGTWWQINLGNGIIGWVNGDFFPVVNGQNVPITG
jgi:uncharacterized protein YgiM (DUF1202 family)